MKRDYAPSNMFCSASNDVYNNRAVLFSKCRRFSYGICYGSEVTQEDLKHKNKGAGNPAPLFEVRKKSAYFFIRFLALNPTPRSPLPRSNIVVGSGMTDGFAKPVMETLSIPAAVLVEFLPVPAASLR